MHLRCHLLVLAPIVFCCPASAQQLNWVESDDCDMDGIPDVVEIATGSTDPCSSLVADTTELSLASGGTQGFSLNAGAVPQLHFYLLLGSQSGTSPGLPVDGLTLPLNLDAYLLYTLEHANEGALVNTFGTLLSDGTNAAPVSFVLPPGLNPGLAGTSLNHAFAVIDLSATPGSPFVGFVSNPVPLHLIP